MAVGVKPGFVSGANARVKLDGLTLAYCTDMSYTVDMATVPIEAIGSYEVKSYEPIAYAVSGNFSVIRYTSKITPTKGKASGNPAEELGSDNKIALHLDPGRVLTSSTFDMEIFQSTAATTAITDETIQHTIFKIHDCRVTRRTSTLSKRGVMVDSYAFVGILAGDTDAGVEATPSGSGLQDLS